MNMSGKILEERLVPTNSPVIRKTYSSSPETVKELQVPFCAGCGGKLKLEQIIWCPCGRSACSDCVFWLDGRVVCRICIHEQNGMHLTKPAFLVLFGTHNGISQLRGVTHLPADVLKEAFDELESGRFLEARGYSIFRQWILTHRGISAVSVYTQVYGKDGDFLQMSKELDGNVGEIEEDTEHGD
jgi:hypothetical protein